MLCSLRCYASRGKTSNNCKKHRRSEEIKVNLEKKRLADGSDGFGKREKILRIEISFLCVAAAPSCT